MCRVIAYYRVSTAAQGKSGLGLEAQQAAVRSLCQSRDFTILGEFVEVESGKRNDRQQLTAALQRAKVTGAVLVVSKLGRIDIHRNQIIAAAR
ncbi:recombinase family protein [Sandaracinobacteroides hominis]|uniref:recombinase family protein n=1 Tax=Sandaracinobacteroides hominis TaxID=2780086 RepID=UPI0018F6ACA9|nr:recombinase family protein [Sandaracinobacteroides hominis]